MNAAEQRELDRRIPHTRGGEPIEAIGRSYDYPRIPHTRGGEPKKRANAFRRTRVFPTRVGVNRRYGHIRASSAKYSPHAWG